MAPVVADAVEPTVLLGHGHLRLPGAARTWTLGGGGRRLYAIARSAVRVVDLVDEEVIQSLGRWGSTLAVSPDERFVAVGGSRTRVYDREAADWRASAIQLGGDELWARDLAFSPDGARVYTVCARRTGRVRAWDVATPDDAQTARVGPRYLSGFAVSPDGSLLVVASPSALHLLDARTLDVLEIRPMEHPRRLAFHPDGRTLAISGRGIRVLDLEGGGEPRTIVESQGQVAWWPDGSRLLCARQGVISVHDPDGSTLLAFDAPFVARVRGSLVRDALVTVTSSSVRLWDARDGRSFEREPWSPWGPARACAFERDGRHLVTTAGPDVITRWDLTRGERVAGPEPIKDGTDLRLIGGRAEVTASGGVIRFALPDLDHREEVTRPKGDDGRPIGVYGNRWARDAYVGRAGKRVCLVHRSPGGWAARELGTSAAGFVMVAASGDGGRVIALERGGRAHVWDVRSKRRIARWEVDERYPRDLALTEDGRLAVALGTGGALSVWDVATGRRVAYAKHGRRCSHLEVAPGCDRVATVQEDDAIVLWDFGDPGSAPRVHGVAPAPIAGPSMRFAPDGGRLAVGLEDGRLAVYALPPPCGRLPRPDLEAEVDAGSIVPWLQQLARAAGEGGYRGGAAVAPVEDGDAIDLDDSGGAVRVVGRREREGVALTLTATGPGWEGEAPDRALVRLARWVRSTFTSAGRGLVRDDANWCDALSVDGEASLTRSGEVLVLEVRVASPPDPMDALEWVRELRRRRAATTGQRKP